MSKESEVFSQIDLKIQQILSSIAAPFTLNELKAFMLGNMLAPEGISAQELLREVLQVETPEEIKFQTQTQEKIFSEQFLACWNLLESLQEAPPIFSPLPDNLLNLHHLAISLNQRRIELGSFLAALEDGGVTSKSFSEEHALDFYKNLNLIDAALSEMGEVQEEDLKGQTIRELKKMLEMLDEIWEEEFINFKDQIKKIR